MQAIENWRALYEHARDERNAMREALRRIDAVLRDDDGIGPGGVFQVIRHNTGAALDPEHSCALCAGTEGDQVRPDEWLRSPSERPKPYESWEGDG